MILRECEIRIQWNLGIFKFFCSEYSYGLHGIIESPVKIELLFVEYGIYMHTTSDESECIFPSKYEEFPAQRVQQSKEFEILMLYMRIYKENGSTSQLDKNLITIL